MQGTIIYCSGDNLGSQLVGGFKEGAAAHRKCRECMGTLQEIISQVRVIANIHETTQTLYTISDVALDQCCRGPSCKPIGISQAK